MMDTGRHLPNRLLKEARRLRQILRTEDSSRDRCEEIVLDQVCHVLSATPHDRRHLRLAGEPRSETVHSWRVRGGT